MAENVKTRDRERIELLLLDAPAAALASGWEPWELREDVSAAGREHGVRLTADEVSWVLREAL